jgi:3-deoxy-D-manno-octulosonic-acid transferase
MNTASRVPAIPKVRQGVNRCGPLVGPTPRPLRRLKLALALYDLAWCVVIAGWLLGRLCRRRDAGRAGAFWHRLGRLPRRPRAAASALWVHAASVGEVLSAAPVLAALKERRGRCWVVLSTTDRRAYDLARARPAAADAVCWLPWDFGPCVEVALARLRPDLLVLVECELWPNLIARAAQRRVSLLMMNARIYERDFPRYRLGRRLLAPLLRQMALIGAQSRADRERFLALGAPAETVTVTGSTKFDARLPADWPDRLAALRALLPLGPGPLCVLASTHEDEEAQILSRSRPLRARFPGLQFLIAPRHIHRAADLEQTAARLGLTVARRTRLDQAGDGRGTGTAPPAVILLDTVGELPVAVALADLVFVGGSLVHRGGHNPIEAGRHGKAMLIGPSVYNFAEVVAGFMREGAVVQVRDADDWVCRAGDLLADGGRRHALGRRAAAVVRRQGGAAAAFVRAIDGLLPRQADLVARVANCSNKTSQRPEALYQAWSMDGRKPYA